MKIREQKMSYPFYQALHRQKKEAIFSITTLASMYGIMWAFCSISQTPLLKFPIEMRKKMAVKIYIVIFMAIVVPLSCTSIVDQAVIQVTFVAVW
jgi:hypothetical protein